MLSVEQVASYERNGFLILENFLNDSICELLMKRANELITDFNHEAHQIVFNTRTESFAKEQYFLASAHNIHFFFENDAFNQKGELIADKHLAINKIGHALHDLDPIFSTVSRIHKIAVLTQQLGIANALLLQSMYICKQPFIGGEVKCHQDGTYLFTKGQPVMGLWFALEDATQQNGCLWAIPGGHQAPLKARMIRDKQDQVSIKTYDDLPWQLDQLVPLEVPRGSVVVLHGLLPHLSYENKSGCSRHAYSLHVVDKEAEYCSDNWLRRPAALPLRGFI